MDYGVILDLETTGIDPESDRIIEIGLLEFAVRSEQDPPDLVNLYGALEDPERPLSPEIQKLTGLNDEILKGQKIEWDKVRTVLERASLVVAHNAAFDRSFIEKRSELKGLDLHWACSMKHIDWEAHGFRTKALNYLAADHGFVNPFAHRALFDCATTFRLILPYFSELLQRSYLREFRLLAHQAPFELRDKLKQQKYRWDPERKIWYKDIMEDTLALERDFLIQQIYRGKTDKHQELAL